MTAPIEVDNFTFTAETDFPALVRDALRGLVGGSLRSDNAPLDWVLRVYAELGGTPYADPLSRGVAAALTAPEPEVRGQALVFFQALPQAAGGERINDLVDGDQSLFAGTADPLHPSTDLQWQLLAALAARIEIDDQRAVDLARAAVRHAGQAAPVIGALVSADPDWVVARAEEIVRETPAAGVTILIQLQGSDRDLADLGRRIAPLCHADPEFAVYVSRYIDDPGVRQEILSAFLENDPGFSPSS